MATTTLATLVKGDRFFDGPWVAIVTEPWDASDRTITFRYEDTEALRTFKGPGSTYVAKDES
jgi:hypothetical protein